MADLYLEHLTGDQALRIMRQAADLMLNGGEYEPVGHSEADALAADLLGVTHAATVAASRGAGDVLGDGLRRSLELFPAAARDEGAADG